MGFSRAAGFIALYVGSQIVALALALPFRMQGLATTTNPNSVSSFLPLLVAIIVAPLFILWMARRKGGVPVLRWVLLLAIASSLVVTLSALFWLVWPVVLYAPPVSTGLVLVPSESLATVTGVTLFLLLLMDPQWYVVDAVGFLAAGSLTALLGISFGLLPTVLLLLALAVYDAVAVYGTKHMVSLAEIVTEMKLPILMVMPSSGGYDYPHSEGFARQRRRSTSEREAMFMGLGDVIFPGVLVVSSFVWLPSSAIPFLFSANLWVALGTLAGSLIGYTVLMYFVQKGNPQAGLPFLNGGAILGFLLSSWLLFHAIPFNWGGW